MSDYRARSLPWFIAVVLALLVAACGGGGNDGAPPNVLVKHVVLTGAQENPAVTTPAAGQGVFSFNMDSGEVTGSVTTFGLNATAAHIHEAAAGINGPVIVPLVQGPPGTWTAPPGSMLTDSQKQALTAGNLYVNVHSAANPGGEIRAQIGRQVWFARLTGAQEAPAVTTTASGVGRFVFNPDTRTLGGTVTTTGITATVAHIHTQVVGVAGPVTIPMTGGNPTWTLPDTVLTEAQVGDLLNGRLYANVHSAAFPAGEIRGQLFQPTRTATLTGSQEVPPVTTSATGICWVTVNPFTGNVGGRIESTATTSVAAHVHAAAPGANGPVRVPMTSTAPGHWQVAADATMSDETFARYMEGNTYCNVHTPANPGGEIRGQLVTVF